MKIKTPFLILMLATTTVLAQKKPERPKVHAEFYAGSLPMSRDFLNMMAKDEARLLLVGLHQGWDVEKIAKETKLGIDDLSRSLADLEDQNLAWAVDEYTSRPLFAIIRESEIEKLKMEEKLRVHTQELSKLFQANWTELETAVTALSGAKGVSRDEVMYEVIVGGLLYGTMLDTFFEDQTMIVPPPRRVGSQRYYGWLIEGNPSLAGTLKREQWESEGYILVSVGRSVQKDRVSVSQVRSANGLILEDAEARRFRGLLSVFSRDKLLPFFKNHRSEMFASLRQFDAGKYLRITDVLAWYYDQMANRVVEDLTKSGKLKAPETHYAYAIKTPVR